MRATLTPQSDRPTADAGDPAAAAAHIRADNLRLSRGGRPVLDAIALDWRHRRIALIGRNGSGKTTLGRAICGLVTPDIGRIRVNGVNVARDRRGALSAVGILFQNPDHQIIFPTVEEEISFGLRQQGLTAAEARDATLKALDRFGRRGWAPRAIATLSQGQRHLVCLIAVLAMRPAVIVLDEPFAGLDIPTARQLRALLDALPQTLVQISHDPAIAAAQDHVLWLERGRIAAEGPPAEVVPQWLRAMERHDGEEDDAFADLSG